MKGRLLIICVFIFSIIIQLSNAITAEAAGMRFSVRAVLPENQVNKEVGYFDLRMKSGQAQTIQVLLQNDTNEEVVVEVHPNTAITNSAGNVEYSKSNIEYDDSLVYPFPELVSTEEEVTIKPNSSYTLNVKMQMPEESFDGMVLGGLYFIEKEIEDEDMAESSAAVQVKNRFSYVIGVKLTETDTAVAPELALNKVYASQTNNRNTVKVNLQNSAATVIEDLKIKAAVYTKNGSSILHEMNKDGLTMAPNSNFDYGISWENQKFKPGIYRLEMKAESGGQQWEWTKYFTVENEEAKILNSEAVELESSKNSIWLWVALCLVGIALIITAFMIRKKNRVRE